MDGALIDYTMSIGRLAARAGRTLVSGGAKGIDQAAMRGALEDGGKVCGVLADSLEKTTMNRDHRNVLLDGQLVLITPYDPSAGFHVGNAMQRNKLIYALAEASLVVSSDFNKGGTWTGAVEQLDKLKFVPVYVRSTGDSSQALDALRSKGARLWPNPHDTKTFEGVFEACTPASTPYPQTDLSLFPEDRLANIPTATHPTPEIKPGIVMSSESATPPSVAAVDESTEPTSDSIPSALLAPEVTPTPTTTSTPADRLFAAVREVILQLLKVPMKEVQIAAELGVSAAQTKVWLQRLVDAGAIEKQKKPAGYIVKQSILFR